MKRVFLWAIFLSACGGSQATKDPIEQSAALIHDAALQSRSVADEQDAATFRIRKNPAKCDCPAFESFVYGAWTRVLIEPETLVDTLGDFSGEKRVTGMISKTKSPDARGVQYLVLTVDGLQ